MKARAVENFHGRLEALPFLAKDSLGRNAAILEDHVARVRPLLAHLLVVRSQRKSIRSGLDKKCRNARGAL
jgi:hypothetical protein